MYYALINYHGSCESMVGLAFGTLEDIKEELEANDSGLIDCLGEDEDDDEEECDDGEAEAMPNDYERLINTTDENELYSIISNYFFEISDCYTEVCGLVDSYEKLKEVWMDFIEGKDWLEDWRFPELIEETEGVLGAIDDELRRICCDFIPKTKYMWKV